MAKELKIVGKRHPKVDAWERVSGKAKYASDIYLPGMLYGKSCGAPIPTPKVVNIDTEKAKALPGVKAVLTPKDMPSSSWHSRHAYLIGYRPVYGRRHRRGGRGGRRPAREALDLIKVEYQVLPFVFDPEEAMKAGRPKIYPKGNLVGGKPVP